MVNCKKYKTEFNENFMNFCPNCGEMLPKEEKVTFYPQKDDEPKGLAKLFGFFKKK